MRKHSVHCKRVDLSITRDLSLAIAIGPWFAANLAFSKNYDCVPATDWPCTSFHIVFKYRFRPAKGDHFRVFLLIPYHASIGSRGRSTAGILLARYRSSKPIAPGEKGRFCEMAIFLHLLFISSRCYRKPLFV